MYNILVTCHIVDAEGYNHSEDAIIGPFADKETANAMVTSDHHEINFPELFPDYEDWKDFIEEIDFKVLYVESCFHVVPVKRDGHEFKRSGENVLVDLNKDVFTILISTKDDYDVTENLGCIGRFPSWYKALKFTNTFNFEEYIKNQFGEIKIIDCSWDIVSVDSLEEKND